MKKSVTRSDPACAFCEIIAGRLQASIIDANEHAFAVLDLRQFHPGHVLVIPRRHIPDIRALDMSTAEALARMTVLMARAVDSEFPSDGLSVWHSAGPGANQEVPHLHFHIHPRLVGDDLLRIYPKAAGHPTRTVLNNWARRLSTRIRADRRSQLAKSHRPPRAPRP